VDAESFSDDLQSLFEKIYYHLSERLLELPSMDGEDMKAYIQDELSIEFIDSEGKKRDKEIQDEIKTLRNEMKDIEKQKKKKDITETEARDQIEDLKKQIEKLEAKDPELQLRNKKKALESRNEEIENKLEDDEKLTKTQKKKLNEEKKKNDIEIEELEKVIIREQQIKKLFRDKKVFARTVTTLIRLLCSVLKQVMETEERYASQIFTYRLVQATEVLMFPLLQDFVGQVRLLCERVEPIIEQPLLLK